MELKDLSSALEGTTFAPYAAALSAGGQVKGIVVRGGAGLSRKSLDELQEFAKRYGAAPWPGSNWRRSIIFFAEGPG